MDDQEIFLEKLSLFSRMLREEGLTVSPQETADAARVLIALGLEDRNLTKTALRTVYAKSREEQKIFDRVFDGFFLSREAIEKQMRARDRMEQIIDQRSREELRLNGSPMDFTPAQKTAYGTMDEESRQRLQNILQKYKDNAARNPALYDNFIRTIFSRAIMEQQMRLEDAAAAAGSMEKDPELGMLYREITRFSDAEIPRAVALIQSITRTLNGELSARRATRGRSHVPDFRRTIRRGLQTGGVFYRLQYRKKRQRRKNLVLLCDVSGSMIQFSEFALRFVQNLNRASDRSRVFLFSEGLHEADVFSLQNLDRFRSYVRDTGLYGRGTDLAQALEKINGMEPAALNSATTLLILSDTKTTGQRRALEALRESKHRAGRVIILNPIPQRKWQYIASAKSFAALVNMVSCATLQDLAQACRKLMMS